MKILAIAAGVAGAALLAGAGVCADNEAGVPLNSVEAAGSWSLESNGHRLCVIDLSPRHMVRSRAACGDALPTMPTAWSATPDGMKLTGPGGQTVLGFHRWSNSLFVAHTANGDLQLRRGG